MPPAESSPATPAPAEAPAAAPPPPVSAPAPPPAEPAAAPPAPPASSASSPAPGDSSAPTPGAPAAAPKTSLEAAVLGLEATGLKLDTPPPEDQIVRVGGVKPDDSGVETTGAPATPTTPMAPAVPAPAEPGGEPAPTGAEDEADLPEPTDAELAAAPGGLRRRFRQVTAQNKRLKDQVALVQPAARQYTQLQSFMSAHELDARSAANALRVAALVQGAINGRIDPSDAMTEVMRVADSLRALVGDALPADVQQRLNEGVIDDATAKEIARLRASTVTRARRAELDQAATTVQATQATAGLVHSAVQAWEASVRARDPDFARKVKLVETTVRGLRLERYGTGLVPTAQEGVALAQEAYELVSNELRSALPPSQQVRSPLSGATPSKSTVRAEPKTSLEAAIQALERMGT